MDLQRSRLFILISLMVVGFVLFGQWQREHPPTPVVQPSSAPAADIPSVTTSAIPVSVSPTAVQAGAELIDVVTDMLKVKIDLQGGDIVRAELLQYPQTLDTPQVGQVLLDTSATRNYIAQSGLIGKDEKGPDSHTLGRARYRVNQSQFDGRSTPLSVSLFWESETGVKFTKNFLFHPQSYVVDVVYDIENPTAQAWQGNFYGQLRREKQEKSGSFLTGIQVYEGAAMYTPDKPYKKISYADMNKKPVQNSIIGGWAAMQEHYFLSAWIPLDETTNNYYTRVDNNIYNIGSTTPLEVAPHSKKSINGRFYLGPEVVDTLKTVAPGLNLTVDYGILWPISLLLFWLLKNINYYVGNWGWSIIFVTLIIKILFYKLSAKSYVSMGKMRSIQPRIEMLKTKHGNDKQQFSMAMMELYRSEKSNPLGWCLPILIQIPVFIALYYVLLESIELRQAPFLFWIQDLSSKDPFYVLPLIMGATMFLQQKMNPAPPDPMQAKMMMFMPVIFTALFLSFPAGLVLYWIVNNMLSIAQQWYITRSLGATTLPSK